MENLVCREMVWPDEIEAMLSIRNAIFPPISAEDWRRYPSDTASMAFLDGIPIGAIPLDQRRFQIAPGVVIDTAFEHAVGTRADFRSRGVGTAMIEAAAEFLRERAEALMVYRGGERSAGYRFYEKSGHRDLVYMRTLSRPAGDVADADVAVQGREELLAIESDLLRVFGATFADYGGFPPREPGYWQRALSDMIFTVIPQDILFVRHPAEGELQAYVIASVRTGARASEVVTILEIAATGEEPARQVIRGVCAEGARRGWPVNTIACVDSPFRMTMRAEGFEEGARHTMIMGRAIAPARLFAKACADRDALAELKINAWSPSHDWELWEGPRARREITLEGKELIVQRLLMRRLDVRAAVASDLLTIRGEQADDRERLAAALPYCRWEYHTIDWT